MLGRIRLKGGPFDGDEMDEEMGQALDRYGSDGRWHRYEPSWLRESGGAVVLRYAGTSADASPGADVGPATALTGGVDGTARLWDATTGQPLDVPPLHHGGKVTTAAFSPDGRIILTGGADGTIRLWDAATGQQIGPSLHHGVELFTAIFSPDGKTILATSWGGTAQLWKVPIPVPGEVERVGLWVQTITGSELDEASYAVRKLDASTWLERRRALEQRGGPPVP